MHALTRRLHFRLDDATYRRLRQYARGRGVPVSLLVREAVDGALRSGIWYRPSQARRRAALRAILAAPPIPVGDVNSFKRELDDRHRDL